MNKKVLFFSLLGLVLVIPLLQVRVFANTKVNICHRTDSVTNPYTKNSVDNDSVDGNSGNDNGQGDHAVEHKGPVATSETVAQTLKDAKTEWGDIIPPHDNFAGLNWTTEGQAIYNNNCNYVTGGITPSADPSETPSETPSEAPSQSPSETPSESPSETPSETPSEAPTNTPTPTPTTAPSNGSSNSGSSSSNSSGSTQAVQAAVATMAPTPAVSTLAPTGNFMEETSAIMKLLGFVLLDIYSFIIFAFSKKKTSLN